MLPAHSDFCHGDAVSMGVSSDHRFTVYPRYDLHFLVYPFQASDSLIVKLLISRTVNIC